MEDILSGEYYGQVWLFRALGPLSLDANELSAAGAATARLVRGPLSSGHVGTIMSYAFATVNPYDFASNGAKVEIVP